MHLCITSVKGNFMNLTGLMHLLFSVKAVHSIFKCSPNQKIISGLLKIFNLLKLLCPPRCSHVNIIVCSFFKTFLNKNKISAVGQV